VDAIKLYTLIMRNVFTQIHRQGGEGGAQSEPIGMLKRTVRANSACTRGRNSYVTDGAWNCEPSLSQYTCK
jgi:hypothetical protein